jgi:hypothetical protein
MDDHESQQRRSLLTRFREWYFRRPVSFDDLGKPLPSAKYDNLHKITSGVLHEFNPKAEQRRQWFLSLLNAAFLIWAVYSLAIRPPSPSRLTIWPILVPVFIIYFVRSSRRRHERGFQPSLSPYAGTLVAMGRCGCCGYTLENIAPTEAGHLQCPECGSSWHRDRLIAADNPADQDRMATRMRHFRSKQEYAGIITDDRGVLLRNLVIWPPKRFAPDLPPRFHGWLEDVLHEQRTSAARIPFIILAVISILAMILLIAADQTPLQSWPIIVVVITIIALLIAYALNRVNLARDLVRTAYLGLCCCPECNTLIPPGPTEFDGCVQCTTCKHAWKANALGTPPPDPLA